LITTGSHAPGQLLHPPAHLLLLLHPPAHLLLLLAAVWLKLRPQVGLHQHRPIHPQFSATALLLLQTAAL
jgi:hypothetical protein